MTPFLIHICDPEPQNPSQVVWVWLCKAATVCPWTAYQCAQTLCISNMDEGSSLRWRSASTMMKWYHFDSTFDTEPKKPQEVRVWLCKAATVCPWTAYQCAQTLYTSNMDAGSRLRWLSVSIRTYWQHFDSTSDSEPPNLSQVCGYNCGKLLPYAHGQHINVLTHFVFV